MATNPRICYCTNIHAGEGWDETFANLTSHLPVIKAAFSPTRSFPVGLRLSERATRELDDDGAARFHDWCAAHGLFVPTLNGFPYGSFHRTIVKDQVYLPDWRSPERVAYTSRLADLLARWLPAGETGSISTVPVGFKTHLRPGDEPLIRRNLLEVAAHLDRLRQASGREIVLSLEPEPGCLLETTEETVRFFEGLDLPGWARELVGICYDCCHQAVAFEEPAESLALLTDAGIRIGKVQVSSAVRLTRPDRAALSRFAEPCYLHQVVIRHPDGTLVRHRDLAEALADPAADGEWRVHFHVPVYLGDTATFGTTQPFLETFLPLLDPRILLEVETYTWQVLPEELQLRSVDESIIRELRWVEALLL